jgi:hypothetical protein
MLKSRFRRLVLMAVIASVGAIGYSYAGGVGGVHRAGGGSTAEGGCPFSAIRAALMGTRGAAREAVKTDADFLAADGTPTSADGDCPDGDCPDGTCLGGAARAGLVGAVARGAIAQQVTKTADGVVIRISSKNPELVKRIQARFQPMLATDAPAVPPVKASSDRIARQ